MWKRCVGDLALAAISSGVLTIGFACDAYAVDCGGLSQRPCKFLERSSPCGVGYVRDAQLGRCALPGNARPILPARPLSCGGLNQRPCKSSDAAPPCNAGLTSDARRGRCVTPGNG